jgi:hypothetical protein
LAHPHGVSFHSSRFILIFGGFVFSIFVGDKRRLVALRPSNYSTQAFFFGLSWRVGRFSNLAKTPVVLTTNGRKNLNDNC